MSAISITAPAWAPDARVDRPMRVVVLKLGGSVLVDLPAYRSAAGQLRDRLHADPGTRIVAIVSARFGETDALLETAESVSSEPDAATLDLLWSSGEIKSAAILALSLQAAGVRAVALDVHQTGIRVGDPRPDVDGGGSHSAAVRGLAVDPAPIRRALTTHDVVVAPGFLACGRRRAVVSLGRGGSDLSAVAVAAALRADRCELLKDVPGYFTADPARDAGARHIPVMPYGRALDMARGGCDLVQAAALRRARRAGLTLVVRAAHDPRQTIVTPALAAPRPRGSKHRAVHCEDSPLPA